MPLSFVTITGPDDSTRIKSLLDISEKFPKTEWGILLSENANGRGRFPSLKWLDELNSSWPWRLNLNLSGHLCGKWVRELCRGTFVPAKLPFLRLFKRLQLNFHSYLHQIEEKPFINNLRALQDSFDCQFIFQLDDVNNKLLDVAIGADINAAPLFDRSGGAGVLPMSWPKANQFSGNIVGYAGGLSAAVLPEQMPLIVKAAEGRAFWIDVETHVRTNELFDLTKVEEFLTESNRWFNGKA